MTGRVLQPDGAPASGASVWPIPLTEDGSRGAARGFTVTGPDGRFSLTPLPGVHGYLSVATTRYETTSHAIDLGPREIGDLHLEALATLVGTIVDPEGRPARGVGLQVHAVGENRRPAREDGSIRSGRDWTQLASDARGRFQVPGLRFGAYRVRAELGPGEEAVERTVTLPSPPIEMVVASPRLVVAVLDREGRRECGVDVILTPVEGPWETAPKVETTWTWPPECEAAFGVVPGGTYSLMAPGRGGTWTEELVTISEHGFEHLHELRAGSADLDSLLAVSIRGPEDEAIPVTGVELRSSPSGHLLEGLPEGLAPDADGLVAGLPAGTFLARVFADVGAANSHGLFVDPGPFPVHLDPTEPFELVVPAHRGARLRVRVEADDWPEDLPPGLGPEHPDYLSLTRTHGVRIRLLDPKESGEPDLGVLPPRYSGRHLLHRSRIPGRRGLLSSWLPGDSSENWRIERPGDYVLDVRGGPWRTRREELRLEPGDERELTIILEAE